MGTKLFNWYYNDICSVFVDGMTFVCSGEDWKTLAGGVENERAKQKKWFDENKFALDVDKIKFFGFC